MRTVEVSSLVLDFDLYIRGNVDAYHVGSLHEALVAGATLPPLLVCKTSRRIVDGFHRYRAHLRHGGPTKQVEVAEKTYSSDADLLRDAISLNANHGLRMDQADRVRCALVAERVGIEVTELASLLHTPVDRLSNLMVTRVAQDRSGLQVPLKRTFSHMAGRRLNKKQLEANERSSGMNQQFYVNQLIDLVEANLLDMSNANVLDRLQVLYDLLTPILEKRGNA